MAVTAHRNYEELRFCARLGAKIPASFPTDGPDLVNLPEPATIAVRLTAAGCLIAARRKTLAA
jgi:hypothetical protein